MVILFKFSTCSGLMSIFIFLFASQFKYITPQMLNPPMFNDSAPSNEEDGEKTWIQAYPSISGKEFSIDYVGSIAMNYG